MELKHAGEEVERQAEARSYMLILSVSALYSAAYKLPPLIYNSLIS